LYILPFFGIFCAKGRQTGRMDTMKQKYTLNIADLQINVISDAPAEEVSKISGILDRKMREIYLKSRCPKTEAALLCALECVAERIGLNEKTTELEDKCAKYSVVLDGMKDRNAELNTELERLRNENSVLRSLLTQNGGTIPVTPQPISPTEFLSRVADAQNETEVLVETPVETPVEEPRRRSRVGSMFEQLSFSDVD
jgi:cell division protein ZapA (FtsZ GTPase activity inhibitor)